MVYVAALDGLGVALASRPLVANAIAQGRLVAPFDIAVGQNYAYYLVIPESISTRPPCRCSASGCLKKPRNRRTSMAPRLTRPGKV